MTLNFVQWSFQVTW